MRPRGWCVPCVLSVRKNARVAFLQEEYKVQRAGMKQLEESRTVAKARVAETTLTLDSLAEEIEFRRRLVKRIPPRLCLETFFLRQVPPELLPVQGLVELSLSDNRLTDFPDSLQSSLSLRTLNLSRNLLDRKWVGS